MKNKLGIGVCVFIAMFYLIVNESERIRHSDYIDEIKEDISFFYEVHEHEASGE